MLRVEILTGFASPATVDLDKDAVTIGRDSTAEVGVFGVPGSELRRWRERGQEIGTAGEAAK